MVMMNLFQGFNSKSALKVHSKSVHVTERKFECDVCHKFYKSEHIRNIHRRRHLVELVYLNFLNHE